MSRSTPRSPYSRTYPASGSFGGLTEMCSDLHHRARALADDVARTVAKAIGRVMQPFWAEQMIRPRRKR
ncbi:hypothetical protein [Actinomadura latina]|uniref:Uncharacterized protein n=1 Tax=Actinomadura latina TaxID=163603 RepID=A0A846YY79_9ACTN|nr:hypothetical protein [Actinomadura latina]NKZ04647.1 hypothetical protein [Actinomadura latina]